MVSDSEHIILKTSSSTVSEFVELFANPPELVRGLLEDCLSASDWYVSKYNLQGSYSVHSASILDEQA